MLKKTVFVLVIPCLLLFSLGFWQLSRLNWKKNIIKNMNLPAAHILPNDSFEEFNYRHVKIDGVLSNVELYVFAGLRGYYALSPMLLANGHYMLVNKGKVNEKKAEELKIEKITADGFLYCDNTKAKSWLIKNDPAANTWFTFNTQEISNEFGIKLDKCVLWEDNFKLAIQPAKHLEYAITWFSLCLVWFIMCVIYYKLKNKAN